MTATDKALLAFYKIAADDDVARMKARAKAFAGSNRPKGLPNTLPNANLTDPDYAVEKDMPEDRGWASVRTCTGTGGGPKL
jgi:hypothetical protein